MTTRELQIIGIKFQRRGLGVNMMDLPFDSACWRKFRRPLVQKTKIHSNSQTLCFVRNGSDIASDLDDFLCSSALYLKSTGDRVYIQRFRPNRPWTWRCQRIVAVDRWIQTENGSYFNSTRSLSFSTQFVCALVSKAGFVCGHRMALLVQVVVLPTIIMYLALGAVYVYARRRYTKLREEWEKEYNVPRRFTYKSLYMAPKGFNKDGLVRKRGFGEVNRRTPIETRRERRRKERKNRN